MFDLVHKHKRIAQIILALLIVPFAFVGVDYYFRRDATTPAVATVGGSEITRAEFDELVRQQQDRLRAQMGRGFDPAIFDNPEVRYSLVEQLVAQRLLQKQARDNRLVVTSAELQRVISELEPFKVDGKFSPDRYRSLLAQQNMTPAMFEQRLRERADARAAAGADRHREHRRRAVGEPLPRAADAAARGCDRHRRRRALRQGRQGRRRRRQGLLRPERRGVPDARSRRRSSTLLLTLPALEGKATVDPAEVKKAYEERQASYGKAEERRASHILVSVKPDVKDAEREAAKAKAEKLARAGEGEPGEVRRAREGELRGPGLRRAGRRPRVVRARLDGEALRGRGVRRQGRRHRRPGAVRLRLPRDPA